MRGPFFIGQALSQGGGLRVPDSRVEVDMEAYTKGTELFSLSKTDISVRAFNIMSSRGCPYLCTYCSSWTVQGRGSRWRDFDNVIGEIRWLNKEYGATKFYLIDDNFIPKAKAVQLFNRLAELDAEIKDFELIVYNLSINATDYDTIDSMIGAGVNNLTFAIESGSKATQDKIKKWVKLDKALDLVAYAQSKSLHVRCFFVVGFPGETVSDMEETFQYAKKLGADYVISKFPIKNSELKIVCYKCNNSKNIFLYRVGYSSYASSLFSSDFDILYSPP